MFVSHMCDGADLVTKFCPTCVTPWTVASQGSLSMGFPRQEYCSGLLFSSPGDLPDPRIRKFSALQVSCIAGVFIFIVCMCVCGCAIHSHISRTISLKRPHKNNWYLLMCFSCLLGKIVLHCILGR